MRGFFLAAVLGSMSLTAPAQTGVLDCEVVEVVPEGANFFTDGFRAYPLVGDTFSVDFDAELITEIQFARGDYLFKAGEATLTRQMVQGFDFRGFAGVRTGNGGTYIGFINQPLQLGDQEERLQSSLTVTKAVREWNTGALNARETHLAKLACSNQGY